MTQPAVWACIVCWRAPPAALRKHVDAIAPQVAQVIVMDNAGDPALRAALPESVRYVALEANLGTAGAINRAWIIAEREGAGALLTLDQDSLPGPGMVGALLTALASLQAEGVRVGGVGPMKIDPRNRRAGRLLMPVRFVRRFAHAEGGAPIEVDHLITSGCLLPAEALQATGPFDEQLFLDYVDIEWCLHARSLGLRHFCAPAARLSHTIGDEVIDLGGRTLSMHQPLRTYLLVRNHLLLWRKPFIPRLWLLSDFLQVLKKLAGLLVLAPHRAQRLRAAARAIADGLRGRGGPAS